MPASDPYRDELRAAQARVALLEEKLADRGPRDDDDPEIVLLTAARRSARHGAIPRVAAGRALLGGLIMTVLASAALGTMASALAHPNKARFAIAAIGCGVVVTGLLYAMLLCIAQSTIKSVDRDLAKRRRLNEESRRLANIDQMLRAGRAAEEAPAPRVRISMVDDPAKGDEPAEEDEYAKASDERRRTR
jgi:hypothetical protein